jgi:hypothetical protein
VLWIGAFAVVYGIALVVLGIRLRGRRGAAGRETMRRTA